MLIFNSTTGELDRDGVWEGVGYSGYEAGRNNPAMENVPDIGPLPRGFYIVTACDPTEHPNLAPPIFRLTPDGWDALGRSGLMIHGDSIQHPGEASHGCLILGHSLRLAVDIDVMHARQDGTNSKLQVV
jgi:Protein of unknown function (DUF2778)